MAEDDADAPEEGDVEDVDEGQDAEGDEPEKKKRRFKGKTLVLFVALPVLLIGGAGGGAYFAGLFESGGSEMAAEEEIVAKPKVFFDLPEMLVNLANRGDRRAQYLKLEVALELPDKEARAALTPVLPRVIDLFQVYLRELRPNDLEGSAGIFRLKEELVRRVNLEIHPHEVTDVLFKQIIVQ